MLFFIFYLFLNFVCERFVILTGFEKKNELLDFFITSAIFLFTNLFIYSFTTSFFLLSIGFLFVLLPNYAVVALIIFLSLSYLVRNAFESNNFSLSIALAAFH